MRKQLLILAALAAMGNAAQSQDFYGGLGLPGVLSLGFSQPMSESWGLRCEYAGGLSVNKDGVQEGVLVTGSVKASRAGIFADWFPFNGGFRLVGGLTVNDIKASFKSVGSGTAIINSKQVNMNDETFDVDVTYPTVTPYIGIGYGHQFSKVKGMGFYADLGVMIGTFDTEVTTSLIKSGKVSLADVEAQTQNMRDSIGSLSVLPSFSMGLTYRY